MFSVSVAPHLPHRNRQSTRETSLSSLLSRHHTLHLLLVDGESDWPPSKLKRRKWKMLDKLLRPLQLLRLVGVTLSPSGELLPAPARSSRLLMALDRTYRHLSLRPRLLLLCPIEMRLFKSLRPTPLKSHLFNNHN